MKWCSGVKVSAWGLALRGAHNWNKVLSTKQLSAILTSPLLPLRWTRAGDRGSAEAGWGQMRNDPFPGPVFLSSRPPVLLSSASLLNQGPRPGHQPRLSQWHFYVLLGLKWDFILFFRPSINIFFSFKFLDDLKEFRSWFIEISEQILEICL